MATYFLADRPKNSLQNWQAYISLCLTKNIEQGLRKIMESVQIILGIFLALFGAGGFVGATYTFINRRKEVVSKTKSEEVDNAIKLAQNAFQISQELQESLHQEIRNLRDQNEATAQTLGLLIAENKKLIIENEQIQRANKVLLEENNMLLRENKNLQEELKGLMEKVNAKTNDGVHSNSL